MNKRKVLFLWLVGLLILLVLIKALSPAEIGRTILLTDLGLLAWAAVLSILATGLAAFNSFLLVTISHQVRFVSYLGLFWMAWALGLVMPGQVGDMGVLSWLMKRKGMAWFRSLGRLFLDKLTSLLVIAALAAWGLANVFDRIEFAYSKLWWLAGLLTLLVLALAGMWQLPWGKRWGQHLLDILFEAKETARNHPWRVLLNALLTVVKVVLLALSFWLVCLAVGLHELPFLLLLQLMCVCSIIAYLPISMNGVGTVEVAAIALFSFYGFDSASVLAAYLVTRAMTLLLAWLPVLVGMGWMFCINWRSKRIIGPK